MEEKNIKYQIDNVFEELYTSDEYNILINELTKITGLNKKTLIKFLAIELKMFKIFMLKNILYKDSYKKHGLSGIVIRISDKFDRIDNMIINNIESNESNESIEDNLLDIANYCIMGKMLIDEKNK